MGSAVLRSDRDFRSTRWLFRSLSTRPLFDVLPGVVQRRWRSLPLYCKSCSRRRRRMRSRCRTATVRRGSSPRVIGCSSLRDGVVRGGTLIAAVAVLRVVVRLRYAIPVDGLHARRCAPGRGSRLGFRSLRAPLYERGFRSASTPSGSTVGRSVARTCGGVPTWSCAAACGSWSLPRGAVGCSVSGAADGCSNRAGGHTFRDPSPLPVRVRFSPRLSIWVRLDAMSERAFFSTPTCWIWFLDHPVVALAAR